jgi:hypothetical protein
MSSRSWRGVVALGFLVLSGFLSWGAMAYGYPPAAFGAGVCALAAVVLVV